MGKQLLRLGILCLFMLLTCTVKAQGNANIKEQLLYSTDFADYPTISNKEGDKVAMTTTTMYSHETLTVSVHNTNVSGNAQDVVDWDKFSKYADEIAGVIGAEKNAGSEIYISKLASVTKVSFVHGVTGSKRGWALWAKGDGDADWVPITNSFADPQGYCPVTDIEINRTNCELKFTNLSAGDYAYLFKLEIHGNVDMSKTPALGTFDYNGTTYRAGEIFTETSPGLQEATIEVSNDDNMPSVGAITNLTFDNGEQQGGITYETQADGSVIATIIVIANGETTTYKIHFVRKPLFTLTYYNTDGNILEAEQKVEKGKSIGTLKGSEGVTVPDGKAFRGWFMSADGGEKYTTDYIVTSDISLYAVATDIETASTTARYTYDLTDKFFYDEDHEAFEAEGDGTEYHDGTHGWVLKPSGKIRLLVGGHAYISLRLCNQGNSRNLTLSDESGKEIETFSGKASADGEPYTVEYSGKAGWLTLTATNADAYIHKIIISNVEEGEAVAQNNEGYYVVNAGDGTHLLNTLDVVNSLPADQGRIFIFLPDGTYDLGNEVLTPISRDNVSIIGQSIDKTIIVNEAPVEGIGVSATFLITGTGTYMQDLTLQNAYDYYQPGFAGRAVVIQDKGDRTICKNVKLLSYQDTYYSNANGQYYFENSDIHGTVDFICGSGDVFFNECTLTVEQRNADGSGESTITAPSTDTSKGDKYGYVFNNCTINILAEKFNFGRAWNGTPRCAYLNTTLLQPEKLNTNRWTLDGMNVVADKFVEYNTMDKSGKVISPSSWILTFKKDSNTNEYETILNDGQAEGYALDKVFADWRPNENTKQMELGLLKAEGAKLSWSAVAGVTTYAIFHNGEFIGMTDIPSYTINEGKADEYTVRAANEYGGFGKAASTTYTSGINNIEAENGNVIATAYYSAQGTRVSESYTGIVIKVETFDNGKTRTTKMVK